MIIVESFEYTEKKSKQKIIVPKKIYLLKSAYICYIVLATTQSII